MNDAKERFDACVKLGEFWVGRHDARREYEWKVSLGFWGVLVAAIHYSAETKKILPSSQGLLFLILIAMFLFFWLVWLFALWKRNHVDKGQGLHYVDEGQQILADPNHRVVPPDRSKIGREATFRRFTIEWSMLFQAGTTLALLVALWRLVAMN
ncbi:MAG: hypothetical protein LAO22_06695 [Acidobacteriia bacterium]|nr:hypothetical protein [Terriglobia bacterium]